MRFISTASPANPTKANMAQYTSRKRQWESEYEVAEDDDNAADPQDREKEFLISAEALPSASHKKFNHRWRGEETGEGEIELYSDRRLLSLTFDSPNALHGTFKCGCVGECHFQGHKISGGNTRIDPDYEWQRRSEAAYHRARRGRWR